MGNAAVTIADGVDIGAQNAGKTTLSGGGVQALLSLEGDTHISGLKFSGQQRVVQFAGAATATGTVTIDDSSFTNCGTACLELTGATQAVVTSAPAAILGNGGWSFAPLAGTSSLSLPGGVVQNYQ